MNSYKKLLKNSFIFALGNLGSKLISILLIPMYTYVLTTSEYGTIDIILTTVSLVLPIITLGIYEATLRFSIKSEHSKESIFTSSLIIIILGSIGLLIVLLITKKYNIFNNYIKLFYMIVISQAINTNVSQFIRGIGRVDIFAISGVINTAITLLLNIIFLVKYDFGIKGYLISILISNILSSIYIIFKGFLWKYCSLKSFNKNVLKDMILYSLPLMPNSLIWWIMNVSDRYIISFTLGVSFNGIYAVAYKIPTILSMISSIFFQAWQISAIEESESKHKSVFYSNIFNILSVVMLIGVSLILVIIKPIMELGLSKEFNTVWKYTPFLLLSVVFMNFSSFLGTNYTAMKKTNGALKTSIIGAVINIILNIVLIPNYGLNGAAFSTMMSFLIVWMYRIKDTSDFVNIKLDKLRLAINLIIVFIQIIILYLNINNYIFYIIQISLLALILSSNKQIIVSICGKLVDLIKSKITVNF